MPLPNQTWTTLYPGAQDVVGVQQPNLTNDSIPGAFDGHRILVEHVHALRDKVQSLATILGDSSLLPGGSVRDLVSFTYRSNVAGQFTSLTDKPVPVGADLVLIEDSAAGGTKKKVQLANLSNAVSSSMVVRKNSGANVGTRPRLNFIEGTNTVLTIADDGADNEIDITIAATAGGVTDHGALTGLGDDDHPIYALLAGRATGQVLNGGAASGESLELHSTSNSTRGLIKFGTITGQNGTVYDEANVFIRIAKETASTTSDETLLKLEHYAITTEAGLGAAIDFNSKNNATTHMTFSRLIGRIGNNTPGGEYGAWEAWAMVAGVMTKAASFTNQVLVRETGLTSNPGLACLTETGSGLAWPGSAVRLIVLSVASQTWGISTTTIEANANYSYTHTSGTSSRFTWSTGLTGSGTNYTFNSSTTRVAGNLVDIQNNGSTRLKVSFDGTTTLTNSGSTLTLTSSTITTSTSSLGVATTTGQVLVISQAQLDGTGNAGSFTFLTTTAATGLVYKSNLAIGSGSNDHTFNTPVTRTGGNLLTINNNGDSRFLLDPTGVATFRAASGASAVVITASVAKIDTVSTTTLTLAASGTTRLLVGATLTHTGTEFDISTAGEYLIKQTTSGGRFRLQSNLTAGASESDFAIDTQTVRTAGAIASFRNSGTEFASFGATGALNLTGLSISGAVRPYVLFMGQAGGSSLTGTAPVISAQFSGGVLAFSDVTIIDEQSDYVFSPSTLNGASKPITAATTMLITGAPSGTAGIGLSYGLWVKNSTVRLDGSAGGPKYVFQFPASAVDPTGGGGAAAGRIPCLIGGATHYLAYY